jgi:DNA-binding LytR/AlgR family response regulator
MDDYIKIHRSDNSTVITLSSMKSMLSKLPENNFVRVHRSFAVPLDKIESVRAKNIFIGNSKIPIGRSHEKDFLKVYQT